jgi:amino acid adenylation domain-containing protein
MTPNVSQSELKKLLRNFNNMETEYAKNKRVHDFFEEQVQRSPDLTAVIYKGQRLSYEELNTKADSLAFLLRACGAGPEVIVGVCVERSFEMIVALLAVLKAGAAYLPLDPEFPAERLQVMLEDSQGPILVTQKHLLSRFSNSPAQVVTVDSFAEKPFDHYRNGEISSLSGEVLEREIQNSRARLANDVTSRNLAYVIYTSGSTGKPKGVMIEHRNVTNFFAGMDRVIGRESGVWLAVTSISFDISVLELFWTLARGFTVVLQADAERLTLSGEYSIPSQIRRYQVTHFQCTPSMAQLLAADNDCLKSLRNLRKLMLGGEAFPAALVATLTRNVTGEILNLYGPTETAIWSSAYRLRGNEASVPIGRPIANTEMYVLNAELQPLPAGIAGELFIGGAGVGRGYLNRPELTAERFLPDPLRPGGLGRIYKTGDLARYRSDGEIEFLGRIDNQIKIRGLRIEPEEIESVLGQHPGVQASAVVGCEDIPAEKRLVAYLVGKETETITSSELRTFLRQKLPPHMVPSEFILLESLPLTPNGKLDRKALPSVGNPQSVSPETPHDQATTLEDTLSGIWAEALDRQTVNRTRNFMDLGADSLMVVEVATKLGESLGTTVAITEFFQYPTIESLAAHLKRRMRDGHSAFRSGNRGQSRKDVLLRRSRSSI